MAITTSIIKQRVELAHGKRVKVLSDFVAFPDKMKFSCNECGHRWSAKPQNVCNGSGCPICARSRAGANISKAARADPAKIKRYREELLQLEEELNITWTSRSKVPEIGTAPCSFACNECSHEWTGTFRSIRLRAGCPACAEEARLAASRAMRVLSVETMNERLAHWTGGMTSVVGEWNGEGCDRTYQCACDNTWDVPGGTRIQLKVSCPECTKARCHSAIAIRWLEEEAKRRRIKIQHAHNGGEFRIPGTRMKVDGYHAPTKTVFEFYGDVYHGNPKIYRRNQHCHPYHPEVTAGQLHRSTMLREQQLQVMGYKVVSIWESDYRYQCQLSAA